MVETRMHRAFNYVYLLITLALVLPVAIASVERAFSVMNIIKGPLQNKMGDQWLSDSLLVYVEKDVFDCPSLTTWYLHGEGEVEVEDEDSDESDSDNDGHDVASMEQEDDMHDLIEEGCPQDPNGDAHKFYKWLEEAEQPLYTGCESYSNLSFVVNLMHIKGIGTMSN
ncbi:unnamed protein product [Prunus armeniaca]